MIEEAAIFHNPADVSVPAVRAHQTLVGVVLLGGGVRPTRFNTSIARSVLELPYRDGRTLFQEWCEEVSTLSATRGEGRLPLRILMDKGGNAPAALTRDVFAPGVAVRFERDPSELRGTGGLLHDISLEYHDNDVLLVANAAQILLEPLLELVEILGLEKSDLALLAHRRGTPSTLMLVRCGCLKSLPEIGYIDMKEQALPQLASRYDVRVCTLDETATLGLRTASSYIAGLRVIHSRQTGEPVQEWRSTFQLIEKGASVDTSARLHDSVVLRGARVGPGAVVVRSVICDGATLPRNAVVVQKLITREGQFDAEDNG